MTVRRLVAGASALVLGAGVALGAAGCAIGGDPEPDPSAPAGPPRPGVLRVLAGSELADLGPVLDSVREATGVEIVLEFTGTLDGAEQVSSGAAEQAYDAVWFSSNRYLALDPAADARLSTATPVMASPVVLGLRAPVAQRLGWDATPPTWADIARAAGAGEFTYGMTDPSASNSGFSALVGVTAALAGTGAALDADAIARATPQLREFFAAQTLSSGSSGWLAEAYVKRAKGEDPGPAVDGIINYESVLLSTNATAGLPEPLTVVHPSDGVVTADYPLTLLGAAGEDAQEAYRTVTEHLRTPDVQRQIMESTRRRPVVPGVDLAAEFGDRTLLELPFPARLDVANELIATYLNVLRRPSRTVYVVDVSGSMEGERLDALKSALVGLSGGDTSLSGQFGRFRNREQVTLLPFSSEPGDPVTYDVPDTDPEPVLDRIRADAEALTAGGDTAIYDALVVAYELLVDQVAADPDRFTSIVLLTDGELTAGRDLTDFTEARAGLPAAVAGVAVFPVLFGDSADGDMAEVARLTGGRTFDARGDGLPAAFQDIRGYQ